MPRHSMNRHRLLVLGAGVQLLLSCHDTTGPETPATVTVQLAAQLERGDTARATVAIADSRGRALTGLPITFSSSNAAVARIDTTGLVSGLSTGTVTITATARGVSGNTPVTIVLTVGTVSLTLSSSTVDVGDSTRAAPVALSPNGISVTGRPVTYGTSNAAVATVSDSGFVRGVAVGTASITATVDGRTGSTAVTVQARPASVRIDQSSPTIGISGTLQLTAAALDSAGIALAGRTITWSSADAQRVTVSATGLATWRAPGRTIVTARSGSTSATVLVATAGDYAVANVVFTQGVQDAAGTIPLIRNGGPAAVLVLLTTQARITTPMDVVFRLLNSDNSVAFSATATVVTAIDVVGSLALPSAQFLLPTAQIKPGLKWQVVRDPMGLVPDDSAATDVFPRAAPATLAVSDVPPLNLKFVPITLASHGGTTPSITIGDLPGYLQTVRSTLPIGAITTSIGNAFTTSASFGTAPTGGAISFWSQVLQELDLAHIADPGDPTTHWYGVVSPPAGFNFTTFGGVAYVPSNPQSTGPGTRTAMGVRTGWFFNQTQARDLVAHELGHNFGRSHSPCGNPSGVDPNYPRSDGTLGQLMYDVFTWSANPVGGLPTIVASNGDLMGYCYPLWASAYTYVGILNGRGPAISAGLGGTRIASQAREDVIVIQGSVRLDGRGAPTLMPSVALHGRATIPDGTGDHRLQGFDDQGTVLFDVAFAPSLVADAPGVGHFTFAMPLDAAMRRLARVRVSGPSGMTAMDDAVMPFAGAPAARRNPDGSVSASCADASARVAVQDDATGQLLGVSTTGSLTVATTATQLSVSCARAVRPSKRSFTLR